MDLKEGLIKGGRLTQGGAFRIKVSDELERNLEGRGEGEEEEEGLEEVLG